MPSSTLYRIVASFSGPESLDPPTTYKVFALRDANEASKISEICHLLHIESLIEFSLKSIRRALWNYRSQEQYYFAIGRHKVNHANLTHPQAVHARQNQWRKTACSDRVFGVTAHSTANRRHRAVPIVAVNSRIRRILATFVWNDLRTESGRSVRGSSRRIVSMRFRPREYQSDPSSRKIFRCHRHCCPNRSRATLLFRLNKSRRPATPSGTPALERKTPSIKRGVDRWHQIKSGTSC